MQFTIRDILWLAVVAIVAVVGVADDRIWRYNYNSLWVRYVEKKREADCRRIYPDGDPPLADECSEVLRSGK